MHDLRDLPLEWLEDDSITIARVIKTWGSSPRKPGSSMFIRQNGEFSGSVSGGCVEGSVIKTSENLTIGNGKLLHFGVSDEDAWTVGLSCGGKLDVFIQKINPWESIWKKVKKYSHENIPSVIITKLEDGKVEETLGGQLHEGIKDDHQKILNRIASDALEKRLNTVLNEAGRTYFIHTFPRKPEVIIIGATHIAVELVDMATGLGFNTAVIDPRNYFADKTKFHTPPDRILKGYPSEVLYKFTLDTSSFCVILSHDPKIDDNALEVLIKSDVAYIGALGSRKNHEKRKGRLREKGFSESSIQKVKGPVGIDINAQSASEIALSIMAEIVSVKNLYK